MSGLRTRGVNLQSPSAETIDVATDPMLENKCLLEPNPTLFYSKKDTLRAFVRVYLAGKIDKGSLEAWNAKFELLDKTGRMESEQRTNLVVDSAPGYLAAIALPLQNMEITPGIHIIRFELRGPGVKRTLVKSAAIMIR